MFLQAKKWPRSSCIDWSPARSASTRSAARASITGTAPSWTPTAAGSSPSADEPQLADRPGETRCRTAIEPHGPHDAIRRPPRHHATSTCDRVPTGERVRLPGPKRRWASPRRSAPHGADLPDVRQRARPGRPSQRDDVSRDPSRIGYLPGELALSPRLHQRPRDHRALCSGQCASCVDTRLPRRARASGFDAEASDRPITTLSKGNRQKIGIILAFMHRPDCSCSTSRRPGWIRSSRTSSLHSIEEIRRTTGRTVFLVIARPRRGAAPRRSRHRDHPRGADLLFIHTVEGMRSATRRGTIELRIRLGPSSPAHFARLRRRRRRCPAGPRRLVLAV